jgi:two-component system, LytTR family, sensor kinase
LLENAIKYGLYGQIEKSEINISLTQFGHQIWVRIQNSYDPENQPVKGTGFGIKSVRQKLYWLFAETNLLETKQDGKTFTVQIKIPLRQHESTLGR